jgi:hypothetical protein
VLDVTNSIVFWISPTIPLGWQDFITAKRSVFLKKQAHDYSSENSFGKKQ